MKHKFSQVIPSPEDSRDYTRVRCAKRRQLPRTFPLDYRSPNIEIYNQGFVGSCVAHSLAASMSISEELTRQLHNTYSRGFIYGNRKPEDYQKSGMIIRQALKQLVNEGVVLYESYPYNLEYPKIKKHITPELKEKALEFKIDSFYRCYNEKEIKECIMDRGSVIVCLPIYDDLYKETYKPNEHKKITGYHAVTIVGWNASNQWIVQNSWGKSWGDSGYFYLDFNYEITEAWGIVVNSAVNITPYKEPKLTIFEWIVEAIKTFFKFL